MSKRRPFQGTRLWREEMAARQAVPEKAPAPDLVGELVEALRQARRLLWVARLFKGYAGGPLHEPWAAKVVNDAEFLIDRHEKRRAAQAAEGGR